MLTAAGGRRGLAGAAKDGANSGHQLARIERLGQVVVSADLQAEDAIDRFASRGKQAGPGRTDCWRSAFNNSNPVPPGKHHIEDDQLMLAGQGGAQAGSVIVGRIHAKAFAFEEAFQQIDQGVVVIDDEQAIHGWLFCLFLPGAAVKNCFEMWYHPSHFLTFLHPLLTAQVNSSGLIVWM